MLKFVSILKPGSTTEMHTSSQVLYEIDSHVLSSSAILTSTCFNNLKPETTKCYANLEHKFTIYFQFSILLQFT